MTALRLLATAALALAGCAGAALDLAGPGRALRGSAREPDRILVESPPAELVGPTGIRATRGELREISVTWDPVVSGQVAGYVVERSLDETGPFSRIAILNDRFETGLLDRGFDLAQKSPAAEGEAGLGDGAAYFYRIRAFDPHGHIAAAASSVAAGRTAPRPDPPDGVRVVSRLPRKVALGWRPSVDPTVTGYVVLRSAGASGPFEPIAELDGRHRTHYVDRGLGDLHVFYYQVRSVNAAGAAGTPSEPVQGLTKPDPLPPMGLRVSRADAGTAVLDWEPNVEPDVVAYRVLRQRAGEKAVVLVATVRAPATSLRDDASGEAVSYQVIAVDADGLESEPATIDAASPPGSQEGSLAPGSVAAPGE